jgi:hypothetical protein
VPAPHLPVLGQPGGRHGCRSQPGTVGRLGDGVPCSRACGPRRPSARPRGDPSAPRIGGQGLWRIAACRSGPAACRHWWGRSSRLLDGGGWRTGLSPDGCARDMRRGGKPWHARPRGVPLGLLVVTRGSNRLHSNPVPRRSAGSKLRRRSGTNSPDPQREHGYRPVAFRGAEVAESTARGKIGSPTLPVIQDRANRPT